MYKKAYVEITNVCNLNCSFCHKPARTKEFMSVTDFEKIASEVKLFTDYIYLHVYGEPLLHPNFAEILEICNRLNLKINITTNGSLISSQAHAIIAANVRKISFSLHSFEGNSANINGTNIEENSSGKSQQSVLIELRNYIDEIMSFCDCAETSNIIIELRLWNGGGKNTLNDAIAQSICQHLDISQSMFSHKNIKLKNNVYLGYSDVFNWASDNLKNGNVDCSANYCLGLRDQFAILCDGSVVPCCIDSEGECVIGNIYDTPLAEILSSELANNIRNNFAIGKSFAPLCFACDFRK